jgi:glycosyltransferase involved in cell wall biosynthesis
VSRGRVALAFPGSLATRTGGYVYDRRLADELEARGWRIDRLSLGEGFPFPDAAARRLAGERLGALPDGTTVLADGLGLGALPEVAAAQARRLDLVALVHHPLCLETGLDPAAARALEASERVALAGARAVVVTSRQTAATLAELLDVPADRISVALPGSDPAPVARGSGGPGCRMLCVGTVTPRKAHALLVAALAGGLADLPWELDLAGSTERDPATAAALVAAIAGHGLVERVHLLGELDGETLAGRYAAADLFVSASLYEGYGMALADALARGLPVVTAAGGAAGETLPPGAGLLVPPGDVAALGGALRRFLSEPGLAKALRDGAAAARSRLPRWQDTAAAVEAVLRCR